MNLPIFLSIIFWGTIFTTVESKKFVKNMCISILWELIDHLNFIYALSSLGTRSKIKKN